MDGDAHERILFYARLSDAELLTAVEANNRTARRSNVEVVASLAELDARQLYRGLGYSSLYTYCTQHLQLSEHEAHTRKEAARAARQFPAVLDMLIAGDLTMTNAAILSGWLTRENCATLLAAARRKTKREVEALVAGLQPAVAIDADIYPIPGGYRMEVTIDTEAYRALQRVQELLRHSIPSGDPGQIVGIALKTLLRDVERRKLADVHRPRSNGLRISHTRHVPADVKRAVWARDKGQCAFVGTEGRCRERGFLELHHLVPFAAGGAATADNLQLRCRTHNVYEEELRGEGERAITTRRAGAIRSRRAEPDRP